MTKTVLRLLFAFLFLSATLFAQDARFERRIDDLLRQMTLEEKIGQLTQYSAERQATGPATFKGDQRELIRSGHIGSMLNVVGSRYTREYQEVAMQSRLKIPLLFGLDVIHGYRTTFPIPLAEAASWDIPAIRKSARIAAVEASGSGIHWTFAPMVDIARDPRWGRVMEGAGEDTYLGSVIADARVRGFQGDGLGRLDSVMACAKHFAAYGAAVGGRDYNSVDMSERQLWETYLPPFKAAVDAGAATFMNSFNDLNGIPATGNRYLQRDILKGKWKFDGFVVSDWGSIGEMIAHGYSSDISDAAKSAILAGSDMDMESSAYRSSLAKLVESKQVPVEIVDDAVRRILRKKFELGLFDDPYRYADAEREKAAQSRPEHREFAREIAAKSIVLLKNEKRTLPLAKDTKTVAFIGPMAKVKKDNRGFWSVDIPGVDNDAETVSQFDGVKRKLSPQAKLVYAEGCDIDCKTNEKFAAAVEVAKSADVVILSVGERWNESGEAKSRSNIHLPGMQEELVKAIVATGKPVVVLINAGRPLVFDWTADNAPAILYTWWLGSEAGNAIADVVFGDHNPSAKLPITFPRSEGQIPIYYNYFSTGRPALNEKDRNYRSSYLDLPLTPKFEFGFGLSYTTFTYDSLRLSQKSMRADGKIEVTLDVKNTGNVAGEEVVQLYLRDRFASVVRPVKELKDFQKIKLTPGELKTVKFVIDKEKLSFFNERLEWAAEPGMFDLMIGSSSADIRLKDAFELVK